MLVLHTKRKFIINPEYFDANNIFSHSFIQNIKHKPKMVQDLSIQMQIALKKQILENSVKQQIHKIQLITDRNVKTEYRGWKYAKNEVVLKPGCISDAFEFREPEFYNLVTTVTLDDYIKNIYTVPCGRCNHQTSVEESKY